MARLLRLAPVVLFAACATQSTPPTPSTTTGAATVFVAPNGSDGANGSRELPFKTIARAYEDEDTTDIVLAAGEYAERELSLARKVAVIGPNEGGAVIAGHVSVRANGVVLNHVEVTMGIDVANVSGVVIDGGVVRAGDRPHALSIEASSAAISELTLHCGLETCVEVVSSTVSLRRTKLIADATSKRGLRVVTSSVSAREVEATGSTTNQVLAGKRARLSLRDAKLDHAGGSALAAVDGASLEGERITVVDPAKFGLLVQGSRALLTKLKVSGAKTIAVGITGGEVELREPELESQSEGAMSVGAFGGRLSEVRIRGGSLRHGRKPGILLSQGSLVIDGTKFSGDPAATTTEGDAVVANSADASLTIAGATFDAPAGFAITMTNGASGTITATITRPRAGGIYIDGVAGAEVTVRGTRVEACATGSGIAVHDSTDVKLTNITVIGCPEAGVLAGQAADVELADAKLVNNKEYGVAAFGGASVVLSRAKVSGSRWATFASCGDGARVEDLGTSKLLGPVISCP